MKSEELQKFAIYENGALHDQIGSLQGILKQIKKAKFVEDEFEAWKIEMERYY